MTEFELFQALRPFYPPQQFALLPQVANGTGAGAFRHLDAVALGLWPSRGIHLHGFEIKTYRGDWRRELKNPAKAEEIHQYCNYWWIVVAHSAVVSDGEMPEGWGLMVYDHENGGLKKTIHAKFQESSPATLPFIAAILRQAQAVVSPDAALAEARVSGHKEGEKTASLHVKGALEDFAKLKQRVTAFEKETGLEINGWRPPSETVRAIKQVLTGTVERERDTLIKVAQRILTDLNPTTERSST